MDLLATLADDLDTLRCTRENLLRDTSHLSLAQVNAVPTGFNNNIVWNLGHCWVTQVLLTSGLGALPVLLAPDLVKTYRKGGAPQEDVTADGYAFIRNGLAQAQADLEEVLAKADWSSFKTYTTSYGKTLHNITEAVRFNNAHEAMHYGVVLAQRKLVA